jgi:hypothetical protein
MKKYLGTNIIAIIGQIKKPLLMLVVLLVFGCASKLKIDDETAVLYSSIASNEKPIPVLLNYSVVYKVDERYVPYDEDPVFIKAGIHKVSVKVGSCIAPVVTIACDFQPKEYKTIEYEFIGGKQYKLSKSGEVIEI